MTLANTFYVNRTKLAEELGVSIATVRNWSKQCGFPNPLPKSGKIPIYKVSEVISWLEGEGKK